MAPNRPTVVASSRQGSRSPRSPVSTVPHQPSAPLAEPPFQRSHDALTQVHKPTPPVTKPTSSPSSVPTPGPTNIHTKPPVSVVHSRFNAQSAAAGIQSMETFAYGLFSAWPLEKLVKLWNGRRTEVEDNAPQPPAKAVENDAKVGFGPPQEVDPMDCMPPPPPYEATK